MVMSSDYDILIKNALIVDGTGAKPVKGSVAVKEQRINAIGDITGDAAKVIDAGGKIVSPGFIDVHNHVDLSILYYPMAESFLRQGVTSFVGGHCGDSTGPYNEFIGEPWFYVDVYQDARPTMGRGDWLIPIDKFNEKHRELYGWEVDWKTMKGYFDKVEETGMSPNMVPLVGHGDIRSYVMGEDYKRYARKEEINQMVELVHQAMKDGCRGLSVGRTYEPGRWANYEEILACAQATVEYGGIYNSHSIRNKPRGDKTPDEATQDSFYGLTEVINIAKDTGLSVQFSHLRNLFRVTPAGNKIVDMAAAEATLKAIDEAVEDGVNLHFDTIPHHNTGGIFTSPSLIGAFSAWLKIAGSEEQLIKALEMHDLRDQIKSMIIKGEVMSFNPKFLPNWPEQKIIQECVDKRFEGKSFKEIGELLEIDPMDAIFEVLKADPKALMVTQRSKDDDIKRTYFRHPRMMVGCDTFAVNENEQCRHPSWMLPNQNAFGGFPFYLRRMVRETGELTVEEAVRKITGLPAEKFKMTDRGVLREGAYADITVWDLNNIQDLGDQVEPRIYPKGITLVIVNGKIVVENNVHNGSLPGKILYREQ